MLSARVLIVALLFALPLQGVMAASRMCMPMTAPTPDAAAHAHHAMHAEAAQDRASDPAAHAAHAAPVQQEHDGAGTCTLCAACCLAAAVASPPPGVASAAPEHADFAPLDARLPAAFAGGLERPPRTI
jgi:hypothetical protein